MIGDDPLKLEIKNTSPPKEAWAKPYRGRYPCGSLVHNGIWYYGTYCLGPKPTYGHNGFNWNWPNLGPMPGFQISRDLGRTWEASPLTPEKPLFPEPAKPLGPVKMGAPHFVDFGKNMEHSPDGKAYLLGMGADENDPHPRPCLKPGQSGEPYVPDPECKDSFAHANLSWISADQVYLARVTPSPGTINDINAYEFFAGNDAGGKPVWTADFPRIKPLLEWNNHMGCVTATYVPGLRKYLMCVTDGWPTVARMNSYILEADAITGPWRMVAQVFDDTVQLPGTTDENHKGIRKDEQAIDRLSRVWYWKGPAWYQREVTIPDAWRGKRVTLLLDRTKHTRTWVDDTFCGGEDTLSAPQLFDVTGAMTPGQHTITIVVDNAKLPPVGPAHAVDERTQTNWNGIIGRMELRATDPVWFDDVQVYPNAVRKQARVRAVIGNLTGKAVAGRITVACASYNVGKPAAFRTQSVDLTAAEQENIVEFTYDPGEDVPLWDEFQPAMLRLSLKLEVTAGGGKCGDERSVNFGMRDFKREGNCLTVNGRSVFLRGRVDSANFPLTGYPPMDKAGWQRILSVGKAWGINHFRFHSWCPPDAAFEAADELGVYFQAELPNKRDAFDAPNSKEAAVHNIDWLEVESTLTKNRFTNTPSARAS